MILTPATESTAVSIQPPRGVANPYTVPSLQVLIYVIFLKPIWNRNHHWPYTYFTDEKTEAQSGWGTCPRSKNQWVAESAFEPKQSDSSIHAHNHWNKPTLKGLVTGFPPLHLLWVPSIALVTLSGIWLIYAHACLPGRLQVSSLRLCHFQFLKAPNALAHYVGKQQIVYKLRQRRLFNFFFNFYTIF